MKLVARELDYFHWWELFCVDDTMLVGQRVRDINIFTGDNRTMSAKYSLKLNYEKYKYIAMDGRGSHTFQ